MDSQIDCEMLDNILENDIILLIGGESDINLLGPDLGLDLYEDMDTTKLYSILDELMASKTTYNIKHQYSTNTTTSTTPPQHLSLIIQHDHHCNTFHYNHY